MRFLGGARIAARAQFSASSTTRIPRKRRGPPGNIGILGRGAPRPSGAGLTRGEGLPPSALGGGAVRGSGGRSALFSAIASNRRAGLLAASAVEQTVVP